MKRQLVVTLAAIGAALAGSAWSHGAAQGNAPKPQGQTFEETPFGKPGDPKKATRTIEMVMSDNMRFTPSRLKVRRGETVRFVVRNNGAVMHEMVLGTMQDLKQHAEMMKKHPGMEHDEPYMAHVQPGKSETLVWQFSKAGEFHYACLLPGHFEAGMQGKVAVGRESDRSAMLRGE